MTMNRFAAFADNGGMPFEKITSRTEKPEKKKTNSRFAGYRGVDEEEGFIPNLKRENTMTDNKGPWHAMLDRQALARQSQTGESYAQAFTKVYEDPSNTTIRDLARFDHLAGQHDAMHGSRLSAIPATKAAPADALQDDVDPGSAEYELHSRVVTRMKNEPNLSYQQAFTREYLAPENRSLKERVTSEGLLRMQAMAPAPAFPRYSSPGHDERDTVNIGYSGAKPRGYAGG
jgi:hypothetical protein